MISIRPAEIDDASSIAHCHVDAWRDAYRPILADEYLANLSIGIRIERWIENLQKADTHTLVAETEDHKLIGFVNGGIERSGRTDLRGEIYSIYLLKEYRRQTIGRRLFYGLVDVLINRQINSLIVWALEKNECRAAYAAWGGTEVERGPIKIGEQDLTEVAYGWPDLASTMAARTSYLVE